MKWKMRRRMRKEQKHQLENRIFQQKLIHEQALHCISEVMQFAGLHSKRHEHKSGNKFLSWICGRDLNELYIGNM
jgi:hypothetical protein